MPYDEFLAARIGELVASEPGIVEQRMRDRPITGWLRIAAEGVQTRDELEPWVSRAVAYARSLPTKS